MTTVLYVVAVTAALVSFFLMKAAVEKRQEANYYLTRAQILNDLAAVHMGRARIVSQGGSLGTIPTKQECELLLERSKMSHAQAKTVLAVLEDIIKENNLEF